MSVISFVLGYLIVACIIYLVAMFRGCELVIAWYDIWIGLFIDRSKRRWYLFLMPCIGLKYPDSIQEQIREYRERAAHD